MARKRRKPDGPYAAMDSAKAALRHLRVAIRDTTRPDQAVTEKTIALGHLRRAAATLALDVPDPHAPASQAPAPSTGPRLLRREDRTDR